jgi:hypothetical protein
MMQEPLDFVTRQTPEVKPSLNRCAKIGWPIVSGKAALPATAENAREGATSQLHEICTKPSRRTSRNQKAVSHSLSCQDFNKEFCMSLETHLAALEQRHDALDKEIEKALVHPAIDELKLAELKRRKLQLKDEIFKLRGVSSPPTLH